MPINSLHPDYERKLPRWIKQRDAYEGEDVVRPKALTYLPRPSGFSGGFSQTGYDYVANSEYGNYLRRAKWYDAVYRTATGLSGVATAKQPVIDGMDALTQHFEDITLSNVSLDGIILETIREQVLIGRYGILVMWSEETGRPMWAGYNAERIINWHTAMINGKRVLVRVVLREDDERIASDGYQVEHKEVYRELYLGPDGFAVATWEKMPTMSEDEYAKTGPDVIPLRNGRPLDFIPFEIVNTTTTGAGVEKGILEGLTSLAYDYYRHSADYEHGLHLTALPTGVITGYSGEEDLYVGSSTFMQIPSPEANVFFLEFHGHGLQSHERAMDTDKKEMANIGARLLEPIPETQETLGAYRMRHINDTGSLRNVVHTASEAYTRLMRIHAWWARETESLDDENISCALNTDFVAARLSAQDLVALMQALNDGHISFETWYYNLRMGEIVPPDSDIDTERELIEMQAPARLPLEPMQPVAVAMNGRVGEGETDAEESSRN